MSNNIISKWLGECRHSEFIKCKGNFVSSNTFCADCGKQIVFFNGICYSAGAGTHEIAEEAPDYENDESAWTQELYGKIEEAGLKASMLDFIYPGSGPSTLKYWTFLTATPSQKADALSRAIEEVS